MMTYRKRVGAVLAVVLAVFAGACGDDSDTAASGGSTTTAPATAGTPKRIVSLSPTATEMLFAIGAGPQVVAVDDQSNYPPEAPKTDLSGYTPNIEAIAGHKPDLVVISEGAELSESLAKVNIATLAAPAAKTLDDSYAQLRQLGDVTGHRPEADKVVETMKSGLEKLVSSVPAGAKAATYYHELDPTYFTATSTTFIGSVYSLLGLENIADPADKDGGGYPQLSAEFILQANPDLIFLADSKCCQQSAASVAGRSGWGGIKAVKTGSVVALDDDLASRWGPRVVDFAESVVESLGTVKKAA